VGQIPVNLEAKNAYQRALELYAHAKSTYTENPAAAYYTLGRVAHLIADMAPPAHVHLDVHISDETRFGDDSFEEYLEVQFRENGTNRSEFESDFPRSGMFHVDYNNLSDGGYAQESLLYRIFLSMANIAQEYDSDDANGRSDHGSRRGMSVSVSHGALDGVWILRSGYPDEILPEGYRLASSRGKFVLLNSTMETLGSADPPYEAIKLEFTDGSETHALSEFTNTDIGDHDAAALASALIPAAIEHTAALYQLFWAETHSSFSGILPVLFLNNGVHRLHIARPGPLEVNVGIDAGDWLDQPVEVYGWLEVSLADDTLKFYFDGRWLPFDDYNDMRHMLHSWRLVDIRDSTWRILDDTSSLPDIKFTINLCIDRDNNGLYTPDQSICDGIFVITENGLN